MQDRENALAVQCSTRRSREPGLILQRSEDRSIVTQAERVEWSTNPKDLQHNADELARKPPLGLMQEQENQVAVGTEEKTND